MTGILRRQVFSGGAAVLDGSGRLPLHLAVAHGASLEVKPPKSLPTRSTWSPCAAVLALQHAVSLASLTSLTAQSCEPASPRAGP